MWKTREAAAAALGAPPKLASSFGGGKRLASRAPLSRKPSASGPSQLTADVKRRRVDASGKENSATDGPKDTMWARTEQRRLEREAWEKKQREREEEVRKVKERQRKEQAVSFALSDSALSASVADASLLPLAGTGAEQAQGAEGRPRYSASSHPCLHLPNREEGVSLVHLIVSAVHVANLLSCCSSTELREPSRRVATSAKSSAILQRGLSAESVGRRPRADIYTFSPFSGQSRKV